MKARTHLISMALAILVPAAIIMAVGLDMLLQWERESRLRSVEEAARATAMSVDREIAVAEASLRGIANSEALKRGDFAQLHREASAMNRSAPWTWTLLSSDTGQPLFNTLAPWGTPLTHRQARWVGDTLAAGRVHVSGYFIGKLSRRGTVSIDVPVSAGDRRYLVSQLFDASYFQRAFDANTLGPDWVVTIFDASGISLARNLSAADYVGKPVRPALYAASQRAVDGRLRVTTRDGIDVYSVIRRCPLSGWTVAIGVPAREIEAPARTATLYAALSMLLLMGLALGIALFLAKRVALALGQAQTAARALGAAAQTAARALGAGALAAPTPTGVLEMDSLLGDLQRSSETLAQARAARERLEEERARLLASEQAARRDAETQSRAKDDFLAMLGHELRNPLAAIAGALAVTDLPGARPELLAHAREISRRQLRHLTRIVDDLLDVRRILSGKVVLDKRALDAGALLRQCVETKRVVDAGAHAWQVEVAALPVEADETRLGQVFDNLLHNAIKYTPDGGDIRVRAWIDGAAAVIEVRDSGVGIAAETLPTIFDPLVQGPTGIDRAQGGLGLGLALVRELTALHGGTVTAHSDGPGRGCVFTLRLPLADADRTAAA